MTPSLKDTWRATFTRRWHTNPDVAYAATKPKRGFRAWLRRAFASLLLSIVKWLLRSDLVDHADPVGWHSARVALIIWTLWPDSPRELIIAALTHDLAESVVGDLPPAGKSMLANAATAERLVAVQNGWHVHTDEAAKLNFADKLDAYLWADHHRATGTDEWKHAANTLRWTADRLGVRAKMEGVI